MAKKITILILIISILVSVISITVLYNNDKSNVIDSFLQRNSDHVSLAIYAIESYLEEIVKETEFIAKTPIIESFVTERNTYFGNMGEAERNEIINTLNEKWISTESADDSFIKKYTENEVALYFKELQQNSPGWFGEIFVTNKYGELIASTGKLSTLAHGHKYWWETSYKNGEGRVFIDDRGFDESVSGYVLGVVVPIYNDGEVIGIIKSNVNIEVLLSSIIKNYEGVIAPSKMVIVRSGGLVVYGDDVEPLSQRVAEEFTGHFEFTNHAHILNIDGKDILSSHSIIPITEGSSVIGFGSKLDTLDHIHGNEGETWSILSMIEVDDIPGVSGPLKQYILYGVLGTLLLVAVVMFFLNRMTKPLTKLAKATDEISSGNLNVKVEEKGGDEIKALAEAFNRMTERLKTTLASRDTLAEEVARRKKAEEEKAALENEVREQQKMESMGFLAGGVAHEINNPLNGIMNYGQLILDSSEEDSEEAEFSREIIAETKRISKIVQSLLQYSRREGTMKSPALVNDILDGAITLIRTLIKKDQMELSVNIPKNLPEIICNSQQIQQVVMNLLTNARDALNEKYSEYDVNKRILVNVCKVKKYNRDYIQISVKDMGKGIEGDLYDKIFTPFFTTKGRTKGTGMGLAICYSIIDDHNGELYFNTEIGEFTEFFILLPI